jgi:hypothetical protein
MINGHDYFHYLNQDTLPEDYNDEEEDKAESQAEAWSDEQREKYYADLKASPLMVELRRIYGPKP